MLVEVGTATSSRNQATTPMTSAWSGAYQANSDRVRVSRQPTPMPRKAARRMKFEKYARRRTYAGIQRMRATCRKRTRKETRKSRNARIEAGIVYSADFA